MSEVTEDEHRIGLTGATREAFVKAEFDSCSSNSVPPTYCTCYANAMADSISIKELKEITAPESREAGMNALLPRSRKTLPDKLTVTGQPQLIPRLRTKSYWAGPRGETSSFIYYPHFEPRYLI